MKHQNNFHFLRFLAASMVIYGHAFPLLGRGTFDDLQIWSRGLFPTAHIGVCIFFAISGYLVCQSLDTSPTMTSYIWKRVLRIFPGLLFALLITVFVIGLISTQLSVNEYFTNFETYRYFTNIKLFPHSYDTLPKVFANNPTHGINGSLWTLAYEFSMYFLLMFVWKISFINRNIALTISAICIVAFLPFTDYFYSNHHTIPLVNLDLYHFLDFGVYFVSGVFYYVFRDKVEYKWQIAAFLLVLQVFTLYAESTFLRFGVRYICLPYVVFWLGFMKGRLNNFGRWGDYSYGIYVFGYPIQQLVVSIWGQDLSILAMTALSFTFVMPLAWISWHFIEKRMMQFKGFLK